MSDSAIKPSKEAVRAWLMQRRAERSPLPDCTELRRMLGWDKAMPAQCKRANDGGRR